MKNKKEKIPTPEDMLFNLEVVFHNLEGMDYAGDVAYLFEGILKNLIKLQRKNKKEKNNAKNSSY